MNIAALDHGPLTAKTTDRTAPTTSYRAAGNDPATARLVSRAVKRAQEGDREALGFLYARYADNVCGYVRSIVHDQHEAEDITQHVFAKLIHVIGKYEERDVPFFAWILRVSRNVAVDHIRRQRAIPVEEVGVVEHGPQRRGRRARTADPTSRGAAPATIRSQHSHSEASASAASG